MFERHITIVEKKDNMRCISKIIILLISGLLGILLIAQAIKPMIATGDNALSRQLRNNGKRFLRSSANIEKSDDARIIPLRYGDKVKTSLNSTIHAHMDDTIKDRTRTSSKLFTTARKNLEYSTNLLNETTLLIQRNYSNIILESNSSLNTTTTVVQPHHRGLGSYWFECLITIIIVTIVYVWNFQSVKKYFIHPILRRLGWIINDLEPVSRLNTTPNVSRKVDSGPLSKKAGLSGMLMTERKLMVNEVFKNCQFCYDSSILLSEQKPQIINEQNAENEDCENTTNKSVEEEVNDLLHSPSSPNINATCQMSRDESSSQSHCTLCKRNDANENRISDEVCSCVTVESANDTNISHVQTNTVHKVTRLVSICDSDAAVSDNQSTEDDDNDNESVENDENECSICLSKLKDKCIVMRTNQCEHVFHVDCSMGWFHKNDYCPYCRCEIMTPTEMIQAAIIVLGKDRVEDIRRRNKMLLAPQDLQQQVPQHDNQDIQNETETDSNSTDNLQSHVE